MSRRYTSDGVTAQLRSAVLDSAETRYALSKRSGVSEPILCRFVAGGGLRSDSIDALCEALGLELRPMRRPLKGGS